MSEWLRAMGPGAGNHLWQSTAFAVVAWLVTLLLRRNQARVRYGVWVAASVKFLVPFSLLIGLGGMLPRPQGPVVAMPVYSAVDEVGMPFSDVETVAVADPIHAAMRPRHEWDTRLMSSLPAALAGLWACGVGVVLAVWCGGWLRVTRTLTRARRVGCGREAEILRRVEEAMSGRMRPVTLLLSREVMEPGMFGIWRPVLIWPERLSERLEDEHIEAIMAHELMHARRRDNLTAALHMIVEAVLWFHPIVWWMERLMVAEREHACDEAVVAMGSRPGVYAESLLKACRFCVESPLVCVAGITGADLAARVRAIMSLRSDALGWWRRAALAVLAVAAIALPMAFGVVRMIPMYGQVLKATGPLPSYDVVVIKPSKDAAHGASTTGEQTQYLVTAKMLIQFAYGIYSPPKMIDLNVVGGPDWINTDVFSIEGKIDPTEFEQEQKLGRGPRHERRQLMEQSLLADRFKLKMHTEMRDEPVYALTVIKGGPKMTPAKDVTGSAHVNPYPGSMTAQELKRGLIVRARGRGFEMTVKGMTLDIFVDALMSQKETVGRQVVNQTGLTGGYDFTLTWGPDETVAANGDEAEEPPLFLAIQQQLGLKLEEGKGPAEVVVIDHIERPVFDEAEDPTSPVARAVNALLAQASSVRVPLFKTASMQDSRGHEASPAVEVAPPASIPTPVMVPDIKFDVVSFKPCKEISLFTKITYINGDSIAWHCQSIGHIIEFAYPGNSPFLVRGKPAWVDSDAYEFLAKVASDDVPTWVAMTLPKRKAMVWNVLVEYLRMSAHTTVESQPVYDLVAMKGQPKLTPYKDGEETTLAGGRKFAGRDVTWVGQDRAYYQGTTMGGLASSLSARMDKQVVDKTDMPGLWDVTLTMPFMHYDPKTANAEDSKIPEIMDGLKEIGLKLQPGHADMKGIVVDHIERPPEN